ncbi:MAG: sporulation protein [Saprospiraceae bacterium]|nr:sporulation protein [Saprospiraceae bacterium]MCB9323609.1 sporulation protein [Lewinellaceae bacterium]
MKFHFEELLDKITDFIKTEAKTETIVGEPFMLGEFSCIPVIHVGMGFGTGAAEGDATKDTHAEGGGAGAGVTIEPIGFLVSKADKVEFVSTKSNTGLTAAFEKVPDLITRYFDLQEKNKKEPALN